jgi:spermidine/putrescine-binding protein
MRRWIYVILVAASVSFLFGLWYQMGPFATPRFLFGRPTSVEILALSEQFPRSFVEEFNRSNSLQLKLTEAKDHRDLLTKILTEATPKTVIIVPSDILQSLSVNEYFAPLKKVLGEAPFDNLQSLISVDFLGLGYDPNNEYGLPLSWGVNGWLVPEDLKDLSLEKEVHRNLWVKKNPTDLLYLLAQFVPATKMWLETGQFEELSKGTAAVLKRIKVATSVATTPAPGDLVQVSNGELTLQNRSRFRLAQEKSRLWVNYIMIHKSVSTLRQGSEVLEALLSKRWAGLLGKLSHSAQTSRLADESADLTPMQRSSFIRELPLRHLEMAFFSEAFDPGFNGFLAKAFPGQL